MATTMNTQQVAELLTAVAERMIADKDELQKLDAELGDGDLGRTVSRGFTAIKEDIAATDDPGNDVGKFVYKQGKTFSNGAPSSFGALFGTVLMTGGKSMRGKEDISLADIADATQAALDALMERGGAKVGDKTMLDAMSPAIAAMKKAAEDDADMGAFFRAAASAAQKGAEDTKDMQSQIGRASWQQERSVGKMDPGARAIAMMLEAAANHTQKEG